MRLATLSQIDKVCKFYEMFKILLKRLLSGLLHEAGLHLLFVSDFLWYLLRWIFEPVLTATLNTITENGKMDGENVFGH